MPVRSRKQSARLAATLNSPPLTWIWHSVALRNGTRPGSRRCTRAPSDRKSSAPSWRIFRVCILFSSFGSCTDSASHAHRASPCCLRLCTAPRLHPPPCPEYNEEWLPAIGRPLSRRICQMKWLLRPSSLLLLFAALVVGAAFWVYATTSIPTRPVPMPLEAGDLEIAWVNAATSASAWQRFVQAVEDVTRVKAG